ncbi:MAG TPA: hypothetical protein VLK35_15335 [Methylomirabilota bacterium]|nr:hypothetical protein [Methylomirabilota bacterium]
MTARHSLRGTDVTGLKGFDGLWNAAVDRIATEGLGDHLRNLDFPAALAVLGAGQAASVRPAPELLEQVAAQVGGAEGERLRHALEQLFVARKTPAETGSQDVLIRAVQVGGGLARPGLPVTPEEAAQLLELLRSGEFFSDAAGTTSAVLQLTRQLPRALVRDVPRTPSRLDELGEALARDGADAFGHISEIAADLLDGELDRPPSPLTNTLRWLYGNAAATAVAETVRRIIARDNETARLAILIYARAHGIPLTPEGLDALHDGPLDSRDPDLGPALAAGVEALMAQRGSEQGVIGVLRRLRL